MLRTSAVNALSRPSVSQILLTKYKPQQNKLLDSMSEETQKRLSPYLDLVEMPLGKCIYEPGDNLRYAYFPIDCIISLLHVLEDGASVESSVVGNEGIFGINLIMGDDRATRRAVVVSAGKAYRLQGQQLSREFDRHSELFTVLLRYIQSFITQIAQTAVCNRHHSIDQQLCRWLLLCSDRLDRSDLIMTHELISTMLGVRREGVTESAGKLQKLGVITYSRGKIRILDRPELERLSCECYEVVKREEDRLMKPRINTHTVRRNRRQ